MNNEDIFSRKLINIDSIGTAIFIAAAAGMAECNATPIPIEALLLVDTRLDTIIIAIITQGDRPSKKYICSFRRLLISSIGQRPIHVEKPWFNLRIFIFKRYKKVLQDNLRFLNLTD